MNPDIKYTPIAVDVGKKSLQIQTEKANFGISNDAKAHASLIKKLKTITNPLVVLEASGGYERPLIYALHQANIHFSLINPGRVRAFAISEGIKAKTDPIDAMVLRRFALEKKLKPSRAPSNDQKELAVLMDRRSQLTDHLTKEKNRLDKTDSSILPSIKKMIDFINQEINEIEGMIRQKIKKNSKMTAMSTAMKGIDGVGDITAWTILSYMPEITELSRNEATSMAGVAPFNKDSGSTEKKRRICGGRGKIRKTLFMATKSAAQCNQVIKPYVEALQKRGKPYKSAIVAGMRKLLLHIRSIMKKLEISLA